jgi:hypothetical protein
VRLTSGGEIRNIGTLVGGRGGAGQNNFYNGGHGGSGGDGVDLLAGGSLSNSGLIAGGGGGSGGVNHRGKAGPAGLAGVGVYAGPGGAATVTNAGTITGAVDSVVFASAGDVLIAERGARFDGAIVGGGGTFEIIGGKTEISGLGGSGQASGSISATFSGFATYEFAGRRVHLSGATTIADGQSLLDFGIVTLTGMAGESANGQITIGVGDTLRFQKAAATLDGTVVNGGFIIVAGSTVSFGGPQLGRGEVVIVNGVADFASAIFEDVQFFGRSGTLRLAQSQSYVNSINGFQAGGADKLDLGDIGFVGSGQATYTGTATGGVLTVSDGAHTASIHLLGDYLTDRFVSASDGAGGVDVVAMAAGGASAHGFATAMAAFGPPAGGQASPAASRPDPSRMLIAPPH